MVRNSQKILVTYVTGIFAFSLSLLHFRISFKTIWIQMTEITMRLVELRFYAIMKKGGRKMMKNSRIAYGIIFAMLFLTEIFIALCVHDNFIRPYIGDVIVTILLCCLCRVVVPTGVRALPIYVFIFAALVETAQYFDIVKLLGFENNAFISTIVGRSFSVIDLICYGVGCLVFWTTERTVKFLKKRRHNGS